MTDVTFNFRDLDQALTVKDLVRKVADINASTTTSDIFELSSKLNDLCADQTTTVQLTGPQAHALDFILDMFNNINADEVNEASDVSKVFKKVIAPSDVPRFIKLLQEFGLYKYLYEKFPIKETIQDLFRDWCTQEGLNQIARDCMDLIVVTGNITWKDVYAWLCDNDSSNDTDVEQEIKKFEEVVCRDN